MPNLSFSLVTEPSPNLLIFYYYYSFFTLISSWCIAPFLFYAIFTKSKNLGKFKWLIFNYSFWSLCISTLVGLTKPLILLPAIAGIQYGLFRNFGDFHITILEMISFLVFSGNCFFGLCSTLAYRYLLVFPTTKLINWFTIKKAIILTIFLPSIPYILIITMFLQISDISPENIQKWGIEYGEIIEKYFIEEQTLFVAPYQSINIPTKVSLFFLILGYSLLVFILIFLQNQIKKYKTKTKLLSKTSKSLILSSLAQIILTCTFFLTPCTLFFLIVAFQIPQTASITIILFCILSTYCLVDFISTLYFITPYRKFIFGLFWKTPPNRISNITVFQISNNNRGSLLSNM